MIKSKLLKMMRIAHLEIENDVPERQVVMLKFLETDLPEHHDIPNFQLSDELDID